MIKTENLQMIPCKLEYFEAILNDGKQLEQMLDITIAEDWNSFPEAIPHGYEYLKSNPQALGWWMYLYIHAEDKKLIGMGGYKGAANEAGKIEIGYAIAPAYRNRGLATEAARGLIEYAFSHPHIKTVDAHTLAETNPSTKVLEKVGMEKLETLVDPEDGEIWHWRLNRENYKT